jgi:hypothetical protein
MLDFWNATSKTKFEDYRLIGLPDRVVVHYATETNCTATGCGFDEFSQSGIKADCLTCEGVGKIITWKKQNLRARVYWANAKLNYFAPTPGVEIGDCVLTVTKHDLPVIQEAMQNERSYIEVDDFKVKPTKVSSNVLPGIEGGYFVNCNLATPGRTAED